MHIQTLFENQDFLIINKPSGLMVHGDGRRHTPTLVDWILEHYPEIKGVGDRSVLNDEEIDRSGIVHRLDEETSGVLVMAKNQETFLYLKELFANRKIQKEYHAFVWGHFKESSGKIDEPIGRNKNDFRQRHAGRGVRGETKEAVTNWEVAKEFEDESGQKFSFMHLFPKTGRTHQLRVHMKYLQRPIVCDSLYASSKPQALGLERLALHAYKISFFSKDGESIEVLAPYPEDISRAVAKYHIL